MAYEVSITSRAARDLAQLYEHINATDSDAAKSWYLGLKESILSLDTLPRRCAASPENHKFRHLLYGDKPHVYRVIYRVLERQKRVEILHIRHGARRKLKTSEFEADS